jgi:hypothetical protein
VKTVMDNESSGLIGREFLSQLSDYQLVKTDCAPMC